MACNHKLLFNTISVDCNRKTQNGCETVGVAVTAALAVLWCFEPGRQKKRRAVCSRMTGDIYYETLELQEGAEFEGGFRCTSGSAPKPVTKDAAAPQP